MTLPEALSTPGIARPALALAAILLAMVAIALARLALWGCRRLAGEAPLRAGAPPAPSRPG